MKTARSTSPCCRFWIDKIKAANGTTIGINAILTVWSSLSKTMLRRKTSTNALKKSKPRIPRLSEQSSSCDTVCLFKCFCHHFTLIFHQFLGQYNLHAVQDTDRQLTELGREQASITGSRLAELVKHYRSKTPKDDNGNQSPLTLNVVKSTMTRATQTADIILKQFPEVKEHRSCDLIREGAPCEPDPPFPEWNPTPSVRPFQYSYRIWMINDFFTGFFHRRLANWGSVSKIHPQSRSGSNPRFCGHFGLPWQCHSLLCVPSFAISSGGMASLRCPQWKYYCDECEQERWRDCHSTWWIWTLARWQVDF